MRQVVPGPLDFLCGNCMRALQAQYPSAGFDRVIQHGRAGTCAHCQAPFRAGYSLTDTEKPSGGNCDFCYAPKPEWGYDCKDFSPTFTLGPSGVLETGSAGGWAACNTCAELIDRGTSEARRELLQRALRTVEIKESPAIMVAATPTMQALHAGFFANRLSGRKRIEEVASE